MFTLFLVGQTVAPVVSQPAAQTSIDTTSIILGLIAAVVGYLARHYHYVIPFLPTSDSAATIEALKNDLAQAKSFIAAVTGQPAQVPVQVPPNPPPAVSGS